jgi:hypothetical protein
MPPDYYRLIGVSETATLQQIKSAYRRKMKEVHPDLVHGDSVERARREAVSKQINEAYRILSNQWTRRQYDRSRAAPYPNPYTQPASTYHPPRPRPSPPPPTYSYYPPKPTRPPKAPFILRPGMLIFPFVGASILFIFASVAGAENGEIIRGIHYHRLPDAIGQVIGNISLFGLIGPSILLFDALQRLRVPLKRRVAAIGSILMTGLVVPPLLVFLMATFYPFPDKLEEAYAASRVPGVAIHLCSYTSILITTYLQLRPHIHKS